MSDKKKILIVEDNELNLKLFRDLLEAHKMECVEVKDGNLALAAVEREQPNLVILDIQLPHVSGFEIARQLKANPKTHPIPIIAVTAFAMRDDEEKILESGAEAYIAKPISIGNFLDTVKKFLG